MLFRSGEPRVVLVHHVEQDVAVGHRLGDGARCGGGIGRRSEERRVGKEGRSRWSPHH